MKGKKKKRIKTQSIGGTFSNVFVLLKDGEVAGI